MERKIIGCIVFLLLMISSNIYAYFDDNEPMLAPGSITTADTLRKGELFFSPWGWAALGINDNVTVEWDWMLAPNPAGYLKVKAFERGKLSLSTELLYYHIYPDESYEDEDYYSDYSKIGFMASGSIAWLHATSTYSFSDKFRVHTTAGLSYIEDYKIWGKDSHPELMVERNNTIYPDLWVGLEYSKNRKIKYLLGILYGNSLAFFDQIPSKLQLITGVSWAPFSDSWRGIFRRMRFDIVLFNTYFLEVKEEQGFGPTLYMYWQFPLYNGSN